jgi:hypothetical protein
MPTCRSCTKGLFVWFLDKISMHFVFLTTPIIGRYVDPRERDACILCPAGKEATSSGNGCQTCATGYVRQFGSSSGCGRCYGSQVANEKQTACISTADGIESFYRARPRPELPELFFSLDKSLSNDLCVVGGFAMRGSDLDESGSDVSLLCNTIVD